MNKRIFLVSVLVGLIGIGYGIHHVVGFYNENKDIIYSQTYTGREYLVGDEYRGFKEFLADNPEVDIVELHTLSSDDPLVTFEVRTYGGEVFPWGELESTDYMFDSGDLGFSIFAMIAGLGVYIAFMVGVWEPVFGSAD